MKITRKKLKILINETLLLELGMGKNPYPFTRYVDNSPLTTGIDKVKYYFNTEPKKESEGTYQYLVEISIVRETVNAGVYSVIFVPVAGKGVGNREEAANLNMLTGVVDFRLFSTIIAIINDFATNIDRDDLVKNGNSQYDPVTLKFEGTSESRNRLYKSLLQRKLGVEARQGTFDGYVDDSAFEFDLPED